MKNLGRVLWGIVLIGIGIIFALNAFEITNINIFFNGWWTLFIIVPCFIGLFNDESKVGNLIGLFIGVFLLLGAQDLINFDIVLKLILPTILICIGLGLVFNETAKKAISDKVNSAAKKNPDVIAATFAEQKIDKDGDNFEYAELEAVFGGVKLDLRKAKIKKESSIKASAIFGGVTILAPKDVKIKVKATPIFGGVTNKIDNKDAEKIIYIDAFCMFGGVEIR